jgi:hypothetical protein
MSWLQQKIQSFFGNLFFTITEGDDNRFHATTYTDDDGNDFEVVYFDGRPQTIETDGRLYNSEGERI